MKIVSSANSYKFWKHKSYTNYNIKCNFATETKHLQFKLLDNLKPILI